MLTYKTITIRRLCGRHQTVMQRMCTKVAIHWKLLDKQIEKFIIVNQLFTLHLIVVSPYSSCFTGEGRPFTCLSPHFPCSTRFPNIKKTLPLRINPCFAHPNNYKI